MKFLGNNITTLADITSVTAGTGLSGGGTSGAVTLNVDAAQTGITSLGTLTTLRVDNIYIDGNTITAGTPASPSDLNLVATGNDVTVDSDTFTMTSSTADTPVIKLLNTTNDDQAGRLIFEKLRADDGVASGQNLGEIWFTGQDNAQNTEDYAYIISEIDVSTSGQESGQLVFGLSLIHISEPTRPY